MKKKDFGGYELHQRIGHGGMATVYLGMQKSLDRRVVVKVLHSHLADDPRLVARFEREARAAAMLRHPNIVQVIDCGRHEEDSFIAMEFVEGLDLQKLLAQHGPPPVEIALLLMRDLASGLEHAHQHRVIHRDIKPANLMLTSDGLLKIMDFGLARREQDTSVTVAGSVLGTPAYMSPEQASGHIVDERSDIFSAGVVGYELLGGRRPFEGDSYSSVLHAILSVDPPPLQSLNPRVPPAAVTVIHRMLEKEASKRYPDMTEVREAVDVVFESVEIPRGQPLLKEYARDPDGIGEKIGKWSGARSLGQGPSLEAVGVGRVGDAPGPPPPAAGPRPDAARVDPAKAKPSPIVPRVPGRPARRPDSSRLRNRLIAATAGLVVLVAAIVVVAANRRSPAGKESEQGTRASATLDSSAYVSQARNDSAAVMVGPEEGPRVIPSAAGTTAPLVRGGTTTDHGATPSKVARAEPGTTREAGGSRVAEDRAHAAFRDSAGTRPRRPTPAAGKAAAGANPSPSTAAAGAPADAAVPVTPSGKEGKVVMRAEPSASFFVDDRQVADNVGSATASLAPGPHVIRATHPQFGTREWKVTVKPGSTIPLFHQFAAAGTGAVAVTAQGGEGATIYLDGKNTGAVVPGTLKNVQPGSHTIKLVKKDCTFEGPRAIMVVAGYLARAEFSVRRIR